MNYHYRHSVSSKFIISIFYIIFSMITGICHAGDKQKSYSPYANEIFPRQVYWGDTHLHTTNSLDARAMGVTLDVEDAYRFARGEQVVASNGQAARLARPLDFLVVSDHSDALGVMDQLIRGNPSLLEYPELRELHEKLKEGEQGLKYAIAVVTRVLNADYSGPLLDRNIMRSVWDRYVETADHYNQPGRFTTLIGYEWTPIRSGDKLHRNVLYRDGAEFARQVLPFTANESINPQDLWRWMQRYEEETGGRVLALAHNGNLSNGQMFPLETNPNTGAPIDADYVKTRAKWEPLYEVTQIKGDGEAHPYLSPEDEFADYETWDRGNTTMEKMKTPDMLRYEYAREALKNGLKLQQALGTNPYQFGMVGSTDSHTSLATAKENNFFGKASTLEPKPGRVDKSMSPLDIPNMWQSWETSASGYAAVWATENTREAIFDAMKRRETYATTGPRMVVRFFGGWTFDKNDMNTPDIAKVGYGQGVPMGGVLQANKGGTPSFLISALKDPDGANLDRVQVIKGWLDKKGNTHEKVYDVSWSGDRKKNGKGKLPAIGNTVDIGEASYTNSIGAVQLTTVWEDPDFNADESAFYYVRVIEIPTPRWTAYDAKFFNSKMPDEVPMVTQDRAYTSPIWYQP